MGPMKAYPSFDAYLKDQPRANQTVIRALRKLVKRAAPSLEEAVKYGNGCWIQGRYPIAYVYAAADHTQFGFMAGSKLADPKRLLAGSGQYVRHVRLRSTRDIAERDLVALLEQAVELGHPAAKAGGKAKPTRAAAPVRNAEAQLARDFAKHEPAIARFGKALRARLRARLPGLCEIVYVYENQNALLIAYSPTEHGYHGVCSIGLYPREVRLFFTQGARLSKADPHKLLQGRGKTVRHVVLKTVADLDRAEIAALMAAALKLAKVRLDARAKGSVIIRAEEQKQRARRASEVARRAAPRRSTGT